MTAANLDAFWMPFTANRQFKSAPKMLVAAEGMYYQTEDHRQVLDGTAGLWCCNAGHGRKTIAEAVSKQLQTLDFAPSFQLSHPLIFELSERLIELTPKPLNRVFFTNSGSESVDTALKIAVAYHKAMGNPSKTRLVGRVKGYHGTNYGGISVGGLVNNRRDFGHMLSGIDHLNHTVLPENTFSKGLPNEGVHLAEELEAIINLHGAENIAALIVEPVVGAGGVFPPPVGYLKRLKEICQQHEILLIFDEVITGFGRLGSAFAANRFEVTPDIMTTAKGLTNGVIPMGAVFVKDAIYDAFMQGPEAKIELFHGYTYSGHPVAAAAALATLDIYQQEDLFNRAKALETHWQEALHSLKQYDAVKDIRNIGLVGAIEFHSSLDSNASIGDVGYKLFNHCFWEENTLVRATGDSIALSPPLIIEEAQIDLIVTALENAIHKVL